jgi:hypothetical protein
MSIISKFAKLASNLDEWITGGKVTKVLINSKIKEYGKVIELKIDNKEKRIYAKALLNGEMEAIEIEVENYELHNDRIEIKKVSSDRAWVNAALKKFVAGKSFTLPSGSIDFINDFLG